MKYFFFFSFLVLLILSWVVQTSPLLVAGPWGGKPNLPFTLLLLGFFIFTPLSMVFFIFLTVFILELESVLPLGFYFIPYYFAFLFMFIFYSRFTLNFFNFVFFVLVTNLIRFFLEGILVLIFNPSENLKFFLKNIFGIEFLLNFSLSLFFYPIIIFSLKLIKFRKNA